MEDQLSKLGILIPGMGAITSTMIAGVAAINKGMAEPTGSFTQMDSIEKDGKQIPVKDYLNLVDFKNLVFGGWDIMDTNMYEQAMEARVLEKETINEVREELEKVRTMPAVFDKKYVTKLEGNHVKKGKNWMELAEQVMEDIRQFKEKNGVDRCVMVWNGSTEIYMEQKEVHQSLAAFEKGLKENSEDIAPSMIYVYAALKMGIPYANGAPNLSCDMPAMMELAEKNKVPIMGKDWKTGQTLMKTILAPGFRVRSLKVDGWFSTNILGNRDGMVLDDPASFKTKEVSKLSVLGSILGYEPFHKVRINYYPPRGDNKEGWDNIDISGFLGYPMQIKVDFLCRDSILAAPLALDIALLLDFAKQKGETGVQKWLNFFFKSPQITEKGEVPVHSIFEQYDIMIKKLKELA
jgi:myo-inositol-1-phosphate synthase